MLRDIPYSTQPLVLSYIGVRRAIGISGLLLPIILGPIGWLVFGIRFQDNLSSYYYTPLRDVFVGTIFAIGIFLFCYRGNDWVENWTANLGCLFAIGIALFPLDPHSDPLQQRSIVGYLHTLCGGAFFLTLSFYSLYHFPSSTSMNRELEPHEQQRAFVYRTSGIVILVSMFAMGVYLFLLPPDWKQLANHYHLLFWLEWIAVWAFAAAWLTKGRTIVADIAIDLLAMTQAQLIKQISPPVHQVDE